MELDEKIIDWMKSDPSGGPIVAYIQAMPDELIRARLLSFLYYITEFKFKSRFDYYIPRRLLTGEDSIGNTMRWANSLPDFLDAYNQLGVAMLHYVAGHSDTQLQAMSSIAAAVLDRHKASLIDGLDEALQKPTRYDKMREGR
jgi:hypothetical protein